MASFPFLNATGSLAIARAASGGPTKIADVMVTINRIYSALVIIVGTIGNLYCVYVIRSTYLRKFSSSQYLMALACSDLGFLLSLSLTWLSGAGVRWYHSSGVCQLANYASYVCCFLSAWYIVCLTAERCVVIHRPFYARTVASPKRARAVICLVTIFGLAMNGFVLILVESQPMYQSEVDNEQALSDKNLGRLDFILDPLPKESANNHRVTSPDRLSHDARDLDPLNQTEFGTDQPKSDTNSYGLRAQKARVPLSQGVRGRAALDTAERLENDSVISLSQLIALDNDTSDQLSEVVEDNRNDTPLFAALRQLSHSKLISSTDNSSRTIPANKPSLYFCLERADTTDLYDIFNTLDMVFSFGLPLLLTFLFNIFICVRLIRASRERKHILAGSARSGSVQSGSAPCAVEEMKNLSHTVTCNFWARADRGPGPPKNEETCFGTVLINEGNKRLDSAPEERVRFRTASDPTPTGLDADSGVTKPLMAAFRKHYDRLRANSLSAIMSSPSLEKERHITLFLVSISLTHLILNLPSYLYRLIQTVADPGSSPRNGVGVEEGGDIESIGLSVLYLLFYTQFAVNFILYSCQSAKIRGRTNMRRYSA